MKISQSLSRSEVEKIVNFFSFAEESGHVLRNSSTDARLFVTEEDFLSKVSNNTAYFENIRTLASEFYRRDKSDIQIIYMINRVSAVSAGNERGGGSGGDFHVDSILSPQFKYFIYLSDVSSPHNGAFENSSIWFTLFCLGLNFLTFGSMNNNRFTLNRFDWLSRFQVFGFFFKSVTGTAGTSFYGSTRVIHRGRPNFKNDRYMLTAYTYEQRSSGFIKMLSSCCKF